MRSLILLTLCLALAIMVSCKDDAVEMDVNSIRLTQTLVNTPIDVYNSSGYHVFFGHSGRYIYHGNPSDIPLSQFFARYDIESNSFETLTPTTNLTELGYKSKLVDVDGNLFYIANAASRYDAGTDQWNFISYPTPIYEDLNQAGAGSHKGQIFYIGGFDAGHDENNKVRFYDPQLNEWFNGPDFPEATVAPIVISVGGQLYVFGGYLMEDQVYLYDEGLNEWTAVSNGPVYFGGSLNNNAAALHDRFIFSYDYTTDEISVFDTKFIKWSDEGIKLNTTAIRSNLGMHLFTHNENLYLVGRSEEWKFTLYKLNVSFE